MDVLTLAQMREVEAAALSRGATPATLMNTVGKAMARLIQRHFPDRSSFLIVAGKGHNGGDGLVAARYLPELFPGCYISVLLAQPEADLGELTRLQLARLLEKVPQVEVIFYEPSQAHRLNIFPSGRSGLVIDAMLGLSAKGRLREPYSSLIAHLNTARQRLFFRTVSLDFPSGLAAFEELDRVPNPDDAIIADLTLAVGYAKSVLTREALSGWVGRLEVIPWQMEATQKPRYELAQTLHSWELATLLPRRNSFSHKGTFGRVCVVGGATGFCGAPVLATQGALATGAGLVSILAPPGAGFIVAAKAPSEVMVSTWELKDGMPEVMAQADAVVVGPGLGRGDMVDYFMERVLELTKPVILDADGLNLLSTNLNLLSSAKGPLILTPHPGEMSRLLGRSFEPHEREAIAREFADKHGVTLVLKGARTMVTAPGHPLYYNTTGNSGLSTGGSGDTLSGIIAALLAQGLTPMDAGRLGVWLHGYAADLVLQNYDTEEGMTPTQVSAHLHYALLSLRNQSVPPVGVCLAE